MEKRSVCKYFQLPVALLFLPLGFLAAQDAVPVVSVSTYSVPALTSPISTTTWRTAPKAPFQIGEDLQFIIKWGVVTGGYATLSVVGMMEVEGRPTYHIVSTARSSGMVSAFYKVEDYNDVWLDQGALSTVRYEKRIREGKYKIEETSLLDQVNHRWKTRSFRVDKNAYEEKEGELPPDCLDTFGSLYYIRALPLEVGQSYVVDVHNGKKVYPLQVDVIKRQKIKVPAGKFDCLLVQPHIRGPGIFIAKGKKLEVWMTADPAHTPVRMRSEVFIGHVSAELIPFKAPKEAPAEIKPAPVDTVPAEPVPPAE